MFKILVVESTPIFHPFNVKKGFLKHHGSTWIFFVVETLLVMKPFSQNKLTFLIFYSHCVSNI
jgi:hypothetical protein